MPTQLTCYLLPWSNFSDEFSQAQNTIEHFVISFIAVKIYME